MQHRHAIASPLVHRKEAVWPVECDADVDAAKTVTAVRQNDKFQNLVNGSLYTQMPQEEDDTEVTLADRRTGKEPRLSNMRCHRRFARSTEHLRAPNT